MTQPYDCMECGACCVDYFGTVGYIQLSKKEVGQMQRLGLPVVNWHGQLLLGTRQHDGPVGATCCSALVGRVGETCACSIHPDRPQACRDFAVGSEGCRFARLEAGLPI